MFQIGIFSTDSDRRDLIRETLGAYVTGQKLKCMIKVYTSYSEVAELYLEDFLKSDICVVDFIDIKESVKLIALLCKKKRELIWLCTGANLQTLMDLLLLRPSGYVPNISNTELLHRTLGRILRHLQRREQSEYFTVRCEGTIMRIPYAQISYFESNAKKVTVHLYNSTKKYYVTAKLNNIQERAPSDFLRCHQSYLVNMECIRHFDFLNKTITALPNEEVLISRRMLVAARESYEAYIKRKQET